MICEKGNVRDLINLIFAALVCYLHPWNEGLKLILTPLKCSFWEVDEAGGLQMSLKIYIFPNRRLGLINCRKWFHITVNFHLLYLCTGYPGTSKYCTRHCALLRKTDSHAHASTLQHDLINLDLITISPKYWWLTKNKLYGSRYNSGVVWGIDS